MDFNPHFKSSVTRQWKRTAGMQRSTICPVVSRHCSRIFDRNMFSCHWIISVYLRSTSIAVSSYRSAC